jgi:stress response protein YsnF
MTRSKKNIKRKNLPKNNDVRTNNTDYSSNNNDDNNKSTNSPSNLSAESVKVIPVVEENFDLLKKTIIQETKIVKRPATKTEKIEVPITYEEVYVNDKKLKIYEKEEGEGILSKLKGTIVHSITANDSNIEYRYPNPSSTSDLSADNSKSQNQYHEYNYDTEGDLVPLIEGQEKNETEKIVPIWGEEIIVSKRKIKLGEIIIRKRRIIENKKIDVDIRKEKVIVEYPDGVKKQLTATSSQAS